ncbi:MAG TPA: tail fiber domain-containing protein, partial [Acidobacteriota bacterium]|nr:tail fiber domain-containing protein [Acidobacteriota bacterium]
LGTDGNPAFGEYDFVSVVLHEIAHGLGFFDTFDVNGVGSWGISGLPAVYDAYVEDLAGTLLINTGAYSNPSTALATALTNGQVFFEGPMTARSPLYAPFPFQLGSSIAHLDEATFPAGSENSLMTPALSNGEAVHEPGPITLSLFEDIGWAVSNSTSSCGFTCDGEGNVGIGTETPQRQLHLKGSNAVFRMDRSTDTAAFLLVRTDGGDNPLKTFVLGTNASGPGQGEFVLNDLGQAVGGPGARRMTVTNEGNVVFTGQVTATGFIQSSSREYKTDIETLEDSSDKVQQLRGVGFNWKETGERSIGLIAEEVAEVLPESVAWEKDGTKAVGVNYGSLVGLLVEATKEQRTKIDSQNLEIEQLREQNESLAERLAAIEAMLERR